MGLLQMQSLESDCRSMEDFTGDEEKHAALPIPDWTDSTGDKKLPIPDWTDFNDFPDWRDFEIEYCFEVPYPMDLTFRWASSEAESQAPSEGDSRALSYAEVLSSFGGCELDSDGLRVNHEKRSRDNHGNRKLCSNTVCSSHVRFFPRSDLRRHFSHDHNSSSIAGALRDIPGETSPALDCHVCRALSRGEDGPDLQRHLHWAAETWKGPVAKIEVAYVAEPEGQGSYRGGYRGGYRWARGGKTALKLVAVASTTLLNRVISEYAMQNTCREGSTETSGKAASDTGLDSFSGQNLVSANKLSPTTFFYCAICSGTMMWAWFCLNRRDHLQGHFVAGAICAWLVLSSLLKFDILTGSLAVLPWTVWSALFSSEVTHSFLLD